jgi:hypothetical protein
MPVVYKSNGGRIGGRLGICRISDDGKMELWIHDPSHPENGHWSEIELKVDEAAEPEPAPEPTPDPDPTPEPEPTPDPGTVPAPVPPSPTTPNVHDAAELTQALNTAQAGDVIVLAPGDYGPLHAKNLKFSGEVMVRSADPSNKARFQGIFADNCDNITFDGLHSKYTYGGEYEWYEANRLSGGSNLKMFNSDLEGDKNGGSGFWATALRVIDVDGVHLEKNQFRKHTRGTYITRGKDGVVRLNEIHDIRSDGINPHEVDNLLVELNYIHDFGGVSGNSDHRDAIQIIGAGGAVCPLITLRKNLIFQGYRYAANDSVSQSIWIGGDGRSASQKHGHVRIIDNLICNSHIWGIGAFGVAQMEIVGNTLAKFPRVPPAHQGIEIPRISVNADVADIRNNVAPAAKVPSVDWNGADLSNQNGNKVKDLTPAEVMAMAQADPELAYHFGG